MLEDELDEELLLDELLEDELFEDELLDDELLDDELLELDEELLDGVGSGLLFPPPHAAKLLASNTMQPKRAMGW